MVAFGRVSIDEKRAMLLKTLAQRQSRGGLVSVCCAFPWAYEQVNRCGACGEGTIYEYLEDDDGL